LYGFHPLPQPLVDEIVGALVEGFLVGRMVDGVRDGYVVDVVVGRVDGFVVGTTVGDELGPEGAIVGEEVGATEYWQLHIALSFGTLFHVCWPYINTAQSSVPKLFGSPGAQLVYLEVQPGTQ
jgi:hypothetical protein